MQALQTIALDQFGEIACSLFEQGPVVVKEAYSEFSSPTLEFHSTEALMKNMTDGMFKKKTFFNYVLYYPEAKGFIFEKRIKLIPEKCGGHTFRFSQNGWGLIQLQCDLRHPPGIECRIAVNSRERALNWAQTCTELKKPSLWDWKIIEKKAGKLARLLRKFGKATKQAKT